MEAIHMFLRTAQLWFTAICLLCSIPADAVTLTISKHGVGDVRVYSEDLTFDCGATCSATVADGTVVELVAAQTDTLAELLEWSGVALGCENNPTCYVNTERSHLGNNVEVWTGYRQGAICRSGRNTGVRYHGSLQGAISAVGAGSTTSGLIDCTVLGNTVNAIDVTSNITLIGLWAQFAPYMPYGTISSTPMEIGPLTISTGSLVVGAYQNKGSVIVK